MNRLFGTISFFVALFSLASCGPAEVTWVEEGYVSNIYMVNKATLRPEFEDTIYRVTNNPWDFGLETGDRAHVIMHYYFDAYSGRSTQWDIVRVVEEIPILPVTNRDSIDTFSYDMPFAGVNTYELYDRYLHPAWVWNNRLNVNVVYKAVPENTQFAMTVRGVSNDTINMHLLAKSEQLSDTARTKLLTFDLNNIGRLLTNDEKVAIKGYDRLKFRIHLNYKDAEGKLHDNSFSVMYGDIETPKQ